MPSKSNRLYCPFGPGLTQSTLDQAGSHAQLWSVTADSRDGPKQFMKSLLDALDSVSKNELVIVVWVWSDFYGGCLPTLMAHCITSNSQLVYYIPSIEKRTPGGFVCSWFSATGDKHELATIMIETLVAVPSRLFLGLVPDGVIPSVMRTCPFEKDFRFWIQLGAYLVIVDPDSSYADIVGPSRDSSRLSLIRGNP